MAGGRSLSVCPGLSLCEKPCPVTCVRLLLCSGDHLARSGGSPGPLGEASMWSALARVTAFLCLHMIFLADNWSAAEEELFNPFLNGTNVVMGRQSNISYPFCFRCLQSELPLWHYLSSRLLPRSPTSVYFFVNFLIFWMRLTTHLHKEINWIWDSETDPRHRLVLEGTPDFLFLPFRCRPSDWEADVGRQWALLLPYHHTRWCGGQEWRISGAACTW